MDQQLVGRLPQTGSLLGMTLEESTHWPVYDVARDPDDHDTVAHPATHPLHLTGGGDLGRRRVGTVVIDNEDMIGVWLPAGAPLQQMTATNRKPNGAANWTAGPDGRPAPRHLISLPGQAKDQLLIVPRTHSTPDNAIIETLNFGDGSKEENLYSSATGPLSFGWRDDEPGRIHLGYTEKDIKLNIYPHRETGITEITSHDAAHNRRIWGARLPNGQVTAYPFFDPIRDTLNGREHRNRVATAAHARAGHYANGMVELAIEEAQAARPESFATIPSLSDRPWTSEESPYLGLRPMPGGGPVPMGGFEVVGGQIITEGIQSGSIELPVKGLAARRAAARAQLVRLTR